MDLSMRGNALKVLSNTLSRDRSLEQTAPWLHTYTKCRSVVHNIGECTLEMCTAFISIYSAPSPFALFLISARKYLVHLFRFNRNFVDQHGSHSNYENYH